MAGPATQAGNAAGGIIEGFLGGVQAGSDFRRTRDADRVAAEERLREQIAAKLTADRQAVLDGERSAAAARDAAKFQIETGLAPTQPSLDIPAGTTPPITPTGAEPTGTAPPALPGLPQEVLGLRQEVGRALTPEAAPEGFTRVGPSAGERAAEVTQEQAALIGQRLGISPDEVIAADRFDLLDDIMGQMGGPEATGFGVSVEGITGRVETPEEAIALRAQLTLEDSGIPDPKVATDLRAEFDKNQTVKDSALIAQSFQRLQSVAQAESSGANDLALIFSFMKMVDPGSTVREGEFANAENAQGIDAKLRNTYNRAITGERLRPQSRLEFIESARNLLTGQQQALVGVIDRFTGLAERSGVPVIDVVTDPLAGLGGDGAEFDEDAFIDDLISQGLDDVEIERRVREQRQGR